MAHGTVLSFSPEIIRSGPRAGFSVSTLSSVHGLMFAAAAWNSGAPEAGTAYVAYSSLASSSLTALANANRNWSYVSGTARLRFTGLLSTGQADFNAEIGSGRTPRNGAGWMATEAAARPRPATIWVSRPRNECPITAGFLSSLP